MRKPLLTILFLCIISFVGGIALVYGLFQIKPRPEKSQLNQPLHIDQALSNNLQTFTEPKFHYSIQFPQDWTIESSLGDLTFDSLATLHSPQIEGDWDVSALLGAWKKSVAGKKITLQEILKDPPEGGFTNTLVANILAYRADTIDDKIDQIDVLFEKDEQVYQLTFRIHNNERLAQNKEIVENIIKSFTF